MRDAVQKSRFGSEIRIRRLAVFADRKVLYIRWNFWSPREADLYERAIKISDFRRTWPFKLFYLDNGFRVVRIQAALKREMR